MFVCFYILTNITNVVIRLNVLYYIMSKIFTINNFVYLFYFEIFLLQIVVIDIKYL